MFTDLITLVMLVLLQAVLGFDNLLYISLESKRAPEDQQARVRKLGIGGAIFLRILLLVVLVKLIGFFEEPLLHLNVGSEVEVTGHDGESRQVNKFLDGHFNLHSIIVLLGGAFIIYTAVKEIFHMLSLEEHGAVHDSKPKNVKMIITSIIVMNLVFSFDSILSAMALARDSETGDYKIWLMTIAIVVGGILMIVLSDRVTEFLKKNRMYEVLGLFILFLVGVMLLSEAGHLAHLHLWGQEILPMTKATFYFILVVLVLTDVVQGRYQRKLLAAKLERSHTS